ncbi:N-acetylmannosamine-6-phosphate 2-epimerase [Salinicoccus jeotgali]|uniref:Putative N-acetylmannosamine-6-phosphate 2-epimerase n=1 Tax=Salinicoccus jeotgali TaxID=381634 RepID=A0ABP7F8K5_9STAP
MEVMDKIRANLIVSCQALEEEPLHSSFIMGRMALAALEGGASGIRANTVEDIKEIKNNVSLPIIGIIKNEHPGNDVFITPTIKEVSALQEAGCEIIAFDATERERPDGKSFPEFFREVKHKFPDQLFMADVSTVEEALMAEREGVDIIATTLVGYTSYTKEDKPLEVLDEILKRTKKPVIAEGNYDSVEKVQKALDLGAHSVVVGSAITRPQIITQKFVAGIKNK